MKNMVINLHLLEACDFLCRHCFAHFDAKKVLSLREWKNIVDNITFNMKVDRFNLAGGEPLLYDELFELADYIRSKGSEVSIITNGYSLSDEKLKQLSECGITMIGLSVDSLESSTLHALGRRTKTGDIMDNSRCRELCMQIKEKKIKLKINSVISRLNLQENFCSFIRDIAPDRWKIIKLKIFHDKSFDNSDLAITNSQFSVFVSRHAHISHIAEETMANAYIMVDASGNLIDTGSNDNSTVANLLKEDFSSAFQCIHFDYETYFRRYANVNI